jgi:hypothetical protein
MKKLLLLGILLLIATSVFAQTIVVSADYSPVYARSWDTEVDDTYDNSTAFLGLTAKAAIYLPFGIGFGIDVTYATMVGDHSGEYGGVEYDNVEGDGESVLGLNLLVFYAPISNDRMILALGAGLGTYQSRDSDLDPSLQTKGLDLVGAANFNFFFTDMIGLDAGLRFAYAVTMKNDDGDDIEDRGLFIVTPTIGVSFKFGM